MKRRAPLTLATALLLVSACVSDLPIEIPGVTGSKVSDEKQIQEVLSEVHQAMEARKIYKVLAHVSQNYYDEEGRDYQGIQAYLNEIFRKYRVIQITRVRPRIEVRDRRARAIETFGTRAVPFNANNDSPLDFDGQVGVYLEKRNDVWKIVEWGSLF